MVKKNSRYLPVVNERLLIAILTTTVGLLWLAGLITLGAAAVILVINLPLIRQIEARRKKQILDNKRSEMQNRRTDRRKGAMSVRAHVLSNLPSPVLLIGTNYKIVFANTAAEEVLGSDIVEQDVFLLLRQPAFVNAIDLALTSLNYEPDTVRYTSSDDRSFDVTIAPILSVAGKEQQAFVFFYEVTSLLRTEQMRVDFVANASHELRTPLASILGFIETLQGPAKDDDGARGHFLAIMMKEASRMARLIDDLLSLSKIEMSRHISPSDTVDISHLSEQIIQALAPKASERGIAYQYDFDGCETLVTADHDQITQVMTNLLSNAGKYANENTTVYVAGEMLADAPEITISVRDEGPGISSEHLARLTERFYRVDNARSRQMGGTGLGLAIVKHILLRHKSQLSIKSVVGEGTEFRFNLPLASQNTNDASVSDSETNAA